MTAALEELLELPADVAQPRAGRVADHVWFALHIGSDLHPDLAVKADDLTEILSDLIRVDVDRRYEPDPWLLQQQARDLRADGADSVLCDGDGGGVGHLLVLTSSSDFGAGL